ncbi:hypothetical protein MAR_033393, partial [Mya arenaria]
MDSDQSTYKTLVLVMTRYCFLLCLRVDAQRNADYICLACMLIYVHGVGKCPKVDLFVNGTKRQFPSAWLEKYDWLRYSYTAHSVQSPVRICIFKGNETFISTPVSKWSDLGKYIKRHVKDCSSHHRCYASAENFMKIAKGQIRASQHTNLLSLFETRWASRADLFNIFKAAYTNMRHTTGYDIQFLKIQYTAHSVQSPVSICIFKGNETFITTPVSKWSDLGKYIKRHVKDCSSHHRCYASAENFMKIAKGQIRASQHSNLKAEQRLSTEIDIWASRADLFNIFKAAYTNMNVLQGVLPLNKLLQKREAARESSESYSHGFNRDRERFRREVGCWR